MPKTLRILLKLRALFGLVVLAAVPAPPTAAESLTAPADGHILVAFVMTEGATMIDFAGPWEVFQDVHIDGRGSTMQTQMPFRLYTVGASREPVRTSGGMTVIPDHAFADAPVPAIIVVGAQRGADELSGWLRQMHQQGAVIMSVCTGAFKLADSGLLDGRKATTHHDYYEPFRKRFPKVELIESTRWVEAGDRLFSAGGLTSGIDLALHVVELYFGPDAARQAASYMEYTGWDSRGGVTAARAAK